MKLYAIVTSERASKGQGGNDYINTEFEIGDAKNPLFIGKVKLYIENELYCLDYYPTDGEIKPLYRRSLELKGNKPHDPRTCTNSVPCYDCEMIEINARREESKGNVQNQLQPIQDYEKDDVLPTEKGNKQKGEYYRLTTCIDCKQRIETYTKTPMEYVECSSCGKDQ